MNHPKVISVQPIDNYQLIVQFSNQQYRCYDVKPLLTQEMFAPLKNIGFFKNVQIEQGGYAISWNEKIDISEYELWKKGLELKDKELAMQQREIASKRTEQTAEKTIHAIGVDHDYRRFNHPKQPPIA